MNDQIDWTLCSTSSPMMVGCSYSTQLLFAALTAIELLLKCLEVIIFLLYFSTNISISVVLLFLFCSFFARSLCCWLFALTASFVGREVGYIDRVALGEIRFELVSL